MENVSDAVQVKAFAKKQAPAEKESVSKLYLIISIVVPIAVLAAFIIYIFMGFMGSSVSYFSQLWNESTGIGSLIFVGWLIGMGAVFVLGAFNIVMLHKRTVKHDTPSIVGPFLHMLFWVYIAYRAYGFITSVSNAVANLGVPPSDFVIDLILFVLTIIFLFEGIGATQSRTSMLTKENVPFVAYIFATAVVMGTVSMTIESSIAFHIPMAVVSAINNIMMMSIAIVYYFSYLKRKLAQENYLERDNYSLHEIQGMFQEFASTMVSRHPTLNSGDVSQDLTAFLTSKDMAPGAAPKPGVETASVSAPEKAKKPKPEKVKEPKPEKVKEPKPEKVKEPKLERVKEPKPEKVKKTEPEPAPSPAKDEEEAPAKDEEEVPPRRKRKPLPRTRRRKLPPRRKRKPLPRTRRRSSRRG